MNFLLQKHAMDEGLIATPQLQAPPINPILVSYESSDEEEDEDGEDGEFADDESCGSAEF